MLNESLFEMNHFGETSKNSSLMDLEVSIKIGNGCPFLIHFYGALYADSCVWILSEIMDSSLEKFCSKAAALHVKLPESFYALISYSVLNALGYMKNLKLIHRDIKPSNILLNSNGDVKLCDFGISGWTTNSVCNTFKGNLNCRLYYQNII
jgi:serine/threonine protein kinase